MANKKNIQGLVGVSSLIYGYKRLNRSEEEKDLRSAAKLEILGVKEQIRNKSLEKQEGKEQIRNIKLQLKENIVELKQSLKNN